MKSRHLVTIGALVLAAIFGYLASGLSSDQPQTTSRNQNQNHQPPARSVTKKETPLQKEWGFAVKGSFGINVDAATPHETVMPDALFDTIQKEIDKQNKQDQDSQTNTAPN